MENKTSVTLKSVASAWANWKEGKDEGYIIVGYIYGKRTLRKWHRYKKRKAREKFVNDYMKSNPVK